MDEIWKDIYYYDFIKNEWIDYRGFYQVSDKGNVKSLFNMKAKNQYKDERIIKPIIRGNYLRVGLCKNGKKRNFSVHKLVASVFIPNPCNKSQINHIDENTLNNELSNLEWVTMSENINHGSRNERVSKKLSIPVIGINVKDGSIIKFECIKKAYGFNSSHISKCCKGKRKTHNGYKWYYESDYLSMVTLSEVDSETNETCND